MCACVHAKSLQSCQTVCDPMDCSLSGFSVHGILQARILEWVAKTSSRGSSQVGIKPGYALLQADSLPSEPPRKPSHPMPGTILSTSPVLIALILPTSLWNRSYYYPHDSEEDTVSEQIIFLTADNGVNIWTFWFGFWYICVLTWCSDTCHHRNVSLLAI